MYPESATEATPLRTLVVDQDAGARASVIHALSKHPSCAEIQQCGDGLEAIAAVRGFKPDVLICEVETAGIDAFALLDALPSRNRPLTILMSRHDRFAARAFDVSAIDYLVKPIPRERILKAFERARCQVESLKQATPGAPRRDGKQIIIRSGRSAIFIKSEELDWAEAEGKYVRLHMGKEFLLVKMSISALESELDPEQFVRIHRSTLVNIDRVRRVQPWDHRRTYQVTLQDGTRLVLSRRSRLVQMSGQAITSIVEAAPASV